ncbi:MAG: hypothetical protein R3B70_12630 [Polyangiaceae bacterium]
MNERKENEAQTLSPVFLSTQAGVVYGLSGGEWAAQAPNGRIVLLAQRRDAFFVWLEMGSAELRDLVERGYAELNLPIDERKPIPLSEIVVGAIETRSAYWQTLALQRIAELEDLCPLLKALQLLQEIGVEQGLRQQARRLLKRAQCSPSAGNVRS